VLVTLISGELTARILLSWPPFAEKLNRLGPTGRLIAQLSRYRAAQDSGPGPGCWIQYTPQVAHARWGWTNKPGVRSWLGARVSVNDQGMRATRRYPLQKPARTTRIEVFGDSFAFGDEAGDGDVFAAQLERDLRGSEVLNFAVSGYGLDQVLLRFREDGAHYHPDIVVIGLASVLLFRCRDGFTSWYKPYFDLHNGQLMLRGLPTPSPAEAYARHQHSLRILDVARLFWERWQLKTNSDAQFIARSDLICMRLVEEIRQSGARPLIVLYPTVNEYRQGSAAQSVFDETCARTHADCLNLMPAFAWADEKGLRLTAQVHWTPAGHHIVAERIAEYLRSTLSRNHAADDSSNPKERRERSS
jgi:lysophospholipase L1-like esterase